MPVVEFADIVDSDADRAWKVLRKFGEIAKWHPAIAESLLEGGAAEEAVGCVRRLTLADGAVMTERLLAIDDRARSFTYRFEDAPLPLDNYVLTATLTPLTREPRAFIFWSARFDTRDADPDRHYEKLILDLIATGSDSLKTYLRTA